MCVCEYVYVCVYVWLYVCMSLPMLSCAETGGGILLLPCSASISWDRVSQLPLAHHFLSSAPWSVSLLPHSGGYKCTDHVQLLHGHSKSEFRSPCLCNKCSSPPSFHLSQLPKLTFKIYFKNSHYFYKKYSITFFLRWKRLMPMCLAWCLPLKEWSYIKLCTSNFIYIF